MQNLSTQITKQRIKTHLCSQRKWPNQLNNEKKEFLVKKIPDGSQKLVRNRVSSERRNEKKLVKSLLFE